MMNKLLSYTLILLSALCFSCQNGNQPAKSWGFRGSVPGRFSSPRGIHADKDYVYIIDRTGRIQRFTHESVFVNEFQTEEHKNGTPTGLTVGDDGTIWVADTHYMRILHYSPEGELLKTFGDPGSEPGQLEFVTDITINEKGELFIVEYGTHDRVQVFTQQGEFLYTWGDYGKGDMDFFRPMAIEISPNGTVYIADAGNHRIKAYTQEGNLITTFGGEGKETGKLYYPYDLAVDNDGNIYSIEFGNHRVQKWAADGKWLNSWGSAGSGPENLAEPWGISVFNHTAYIADTKNHRIQVLPLQYFSK